MELGSAAAAAGGGGPPDPASRRGPLCWNSRSVRYPAEPGASSELHPTWSSLHHVQVGREDCSLPIVSHLEVVTPLLRLPSLVSVDFSKPVSSSFQSHTSQFVAQSGGRAQVVLSWWDLDMDPSGSIVCTMAPSWMYPEPKTAPVSYRTTRHEPDSHQRPLITGLCVF